MIILDLFHNKVNDCRGQSSDLTPNYNVAGIPLIPGYVEILNGDPLSGKIMSFRFN